MTDPATNGANVIPAPGRAARFYASRLNWAVFPLHSVDVAGACTCGRPDCGSPGKHPRTARGFLDATTDTAQIDAWWSEWPEANVGIATGAISGLVVLDVDPRNAGDYSLDDITHRNGPVPDTVQSLTGGGGNHYLFRYPEGTPEGARIKSGKLAAGLDVKADGGYIVAPPSRHPSGRRYTWEASSVPGELPLADPPTWLNVTARVAPERGPSGPLTSSVLFRAFSAAGLLRKIIDATRAAVVCPWAREHTSEAGAADTSSVIFAPSEGKTLGYFHCSHAHCADRSPEDVLHALPPDAVRAAQGQPTAASVDPEEDPTAWQASLARGRPHADGSPGPVKNTFGNLVLILRHTYGDRLRYNTMAVCPELDGRSLGDADVSRVREDLERAWRIMPGSENTAQALRQIAEEHTYHPVQCYLSGLVWDGEVRLNTAAERYLGIDPIVDPLAAMLLRRWFISAVARAMLPGCKVDTSLVLVGPQGLYKSRFFDVLGGQWFADTAMDLSSKDGLMQLAGTWIYEWPEIENVTSRRQASEVKAFTASRTDMFRPPYARAVIKHQRSSVIVGTTNMRQFLNDETGSRRFWVLSVNRRIDVEALRAVRDQLWAEARVAFECGETWWLEQVEDEQREVAAEEFQIEDAWETAISRWLSQPRPDDNGPITMAMLMTAALRLDPKDQTQANQNRAGRIMRRLGYDNPKARVAGASVRTWVRSRRGEYGSTVTA